MSKATIVIGCGFGDECKGATVDYLCSKEKVDLVVRFNGGFQAAHNVVLSDGRHHCFSQFGSGTLRGVSTYLDRHVIIEPSALRAEANHLIKLGIENPYSMINIHEDCLISTIYHKILNRELDKRNGHGSCGVGIGVTRQMWSETGDGLTMGDLISPRLLRKKLNWIRQWSQDKLSSYDDGHTTDINIDWRGNEVDCFVEVDRLLSVPIYDRICNESIIKPANSIVFEGAQGFGLDEVYGTIPHTTYSNTRPTYAAELCEEFGVDYEVLGVTRCYETRHGNGPMYNEDLSETPFVNVSQDHNYNNGSLAGKFRVGAINHNGVKEAMKICGVNRLAVSCLDHLGSLTQEVVLGLLPKADILSYGPTAEDRVTS